MRLGVCPFHAETEGSFTVYADTQRFYCFGWGQSGEVLDFIQRTDGVELPDAINRLQGRGGRKFSYIEGHTAIDQATQVFGDGGWGYELVGDVSLRQIESVAPRSGDVIGSAAYSTVVRVTVAGAPSRTDVGFQPITDESAEGHETAFKGAVTDALKRALRSFVDRFGNGLYGDPPTASSGGGDAEPGSGPQRSAVSGALGRRAPDPSAARRSRRSRRSPAARDDRADVRNLRAQLIELSLQQGFSEEQVRGAVPNKRGRDRDEPESVSVEVSPRLTITGHPDATGFLPPDGGTIAAVEQFLFGEDEPADDGSEIVIEVKTRGPEAFKRWQTLGGERSHPDSVAQAACYSLGLFGEVRDVVIATLDTGSRRWDHEVIPAGRVERA